MYRVRWKKTALNDLARLWTLSDSAGRQAINAATNRIDQQLQNDPLTAGESRPQGRRILFAFPLGIIFRVEVDRQTVSILRTWLYRKLAS